MTEEPKIPKDAHKIEILRSLWPLRLQLRRNAPEDAVRLLADTIWGTPGGTRYRHLDTTRKIGRVHNPFWLELRKANSLLATLCLAQRDVPAAGNPAQNLNAFYVRYFSFAEALRRKTQAGKNATAGSFRENSLLKRSARDFFAEPAALFEATGQDHALLYAYVELENERSQQMTRMMGFEALGQFSTQVFSRIFPRNFSNARRAKTEEQVELRTRLAEFYQGHSLYTDRHLFLDDQYFVWEEKGRIVAGLQGHPVHWQVVEMPGLSGRMIMGLVPRIPLLSRIFNPKKFNFLAVEGMFCEPGREDLLLKLMEAACKQSGMYSAIFWLDHRDPLRDRITKAGRLGLLNRMNRNTPPIDVIFRAPGLSPTETEALRTRPVYVSAFDAT